MINSLSNGVSVVKCLHGSDSVVSFIKIAVAYFASARVKSDVVFIQQLVKYINIPYLNCWRNVYEPFAD